MQDLNDLFFFAKVVEHSGFMAASRLLGIPKSRLSRRVAELEERLGVRLLHRTTRKLALTEVGSAYYQHCQAVLAEAEAAEETIARASAEPRGLVRVSCPELLAKNLLGPILPRFMSANPHVRITLEASNRRIDLIEEGIDVALRVRTVIEDSGHLVARPLGVAQEVMVASPDLIAAHGRPALPADLKNMPWLSMSRPDGRGHWAFLDPDGHETHLQIEAPRLMTDDLLVLRDAALGGIGAAILPRLVCNDALQDGRLEVLLPDYRIPGGILHVAFPSRRGLVPSVRRFIDFLALELVPPDHPGYRRL
ncbi:LysR substrate-binding domain-containing protein [Paludibacterium yongneupense]|uniref:LysR substrate-binding domain-containing protein n=1 Tax=Paludibacterium yongneupense TaxID=400061 RepID=UPI0003F69C8D|nr:LysR substrate-binding domain-containing protein [Paludibacterium yongneupense]